MGEITGSSYKLVVELVTEIRYSPVTEDRQVEDSAMISQADNQK